MGNYNLVVNTARRLIELGVKSPAINFSVQNEQCLSTKHWKVMEAFQILS